jgi:hypothetical protein
MTGLELLQAIASGDAPGVPIAEHSGRLLARGTTTCLLVSGDGHAD